MVNYSQVQNAILNYIIRTSGVESASFNDCSLSHQDFSGRQPPKIEDPREESIFYMVIKSLHILVPHSRTFRPTRLLEILQDFGLEFGWFSSEYTLIVVVLTIALDMA